MPELLHNRNFTLEKASVSAYKIPTEAPESDGTLKWDHTTLVLVQLESNGVEGIGYTYANPATAFMINRQLLSLLEDENILNISLLWEKMLHHIRNLGRPGISSMAIAAVDNALWDLKAKILNLPLCTLFGQIHSEIPVYASGGFTSYDPAEISEKFGQLFQKGHNKFKMKIGRDKSEDLRRIEAARKAIGDSELFVDANGAYFPREAIKMSREMKDFNIKWFEEPVTSDDLAGMKRVRDKAPPGMNITAGEYGYSSNYFKRMLESGAVDVLQADATRCAGFTGLFRAAVLCESFHLPFSTHCAPYLHLHAAVAVKNCVHMEYFRDHVRIEKMLFEGPEEVEDGKLSPDLSQPGMGLHFKHQDAKKFKINF
ncbi:MAG: enolase C-terminal domain-like protein [Gillisia sp.]